MESARTITRERLRNYSVLIGKCSKSAAAYAACVTRRDIDVKKNLCEVEFQEFKKCLATVRK
jgi:hypothetical protein